MELVKQLAINIIEIPFLEHILLPIASSFAQALPLLRIVCILHFN
jgi:hypothetical protein